ncbi:MAG: paraquat-inducible protein A, partial [Verrucomicrobiota bacterium]|nr:paraquat-inducible protein A [Verrucomicrobiota bacterium]
MSAFDPASAAAAGLALCHACGRVDPIELEHCPRCHARLHLRNPDSVQRTLALTFGALILYLPANLLPMLRVESIKGTQENTIIGGVIQFWQDQDYPVAIIIFTASILIPILKMVSIILLCCAARTGQHPRGMTRLYRMTEFVGRWSMVDVFVVAILVAVVQLGSAMSIHAGAAAVSFAAVVI